jgi:hypothetical protein
MAIALDGASVARIERVLERDRARMPLPEALGRRLGVESWMVTLDPSGRVRAITLLGTGAAPSPPPDDAASVAAVESPLDRRYPLPATGVLARILGDTTGTGRQLADLALRGDDPAVRAEAVRVAVDAMMRDPRLERALLESLGAIDDDALARVLAGVAGDGAAGLASLVAERARGRPLGRRAAEVRDRLLAR